VARWTGLWESASWADAAQDWIDRVLEAYGVARNGELERVSRGLSATVLRVPTEAGTLFFKASAPPRAHEAELLARIAPHSRGHVPTPLAVELDEGWSLSPGLGTPLSDGRTPRAAGEAAREASARTWRRAFADAADLQLAFSAAQDPLAEGGMPGFLPGQAAEYLDEALMRHASYPAGHPLHVGAADADLLARGLGAVESAAAALEAAGLPLTLQQGSLLPSQIVAPSASRAPTMFIGWGEARWSHPFGLIGEAVQRMCEVYGVEPTQEPVRSMVRAYLAPFEACAGAGGADLVDLIGPASLVAAAQRHEALMELLDDADPADQEAASPEVMRLLATALAATHRVSRRSAATGRLPRVRRPGGVQAGRRAAR